jgi:Calcineurin-like phosphoesterase
MPILISGDIHWSDDPRDAYRHEWVAWFLTQIKKHKADGVVLLGDYTEAKDRHSGWLVNKVVEHLHAMAQLCPVIALLANHDYLGDPASATFGLVSRIEGLTWVSTPKAGKDLPAAFSMGLAPALFLPYTADYKRDWDPWMDRGGFGNYAPIFAHQTFTGALGESGRRMEGVPVDIFPEDAMVIAGDIHVPQKLGPVTYVGAPYSIDFGDQFAGRILKLEGRKLTSVVYHGPQKLLLEIDDVSDLNKDATNGGDIVKVKVNIADREKWAETKDAVMRWGEKQKVWVYSVVPVMQKAKQRVRGQVEARSDGELLGVFCKSRNLSESVAKTGRFLMEKA